MKSKRELSKDQNGNLQSIFDKKPKGWWNGQLYMGKLQELLIPKEN